MTRNQELLEQFDEAVDHLENLMDSFLSSDPSLDERWLGFRAELQRVTQMDVPTYQPEEGGIA